MQVAGQATSSHPVRGEAGPQDTSTRRGPGRFGPPLRLRRVTSTQELAVEAALGGTPEGLVVVADEQLAGRGRLDRRFAAPAGGSLLCSVLLRPDLAAPQLHGCASVVGLAALSACRAFGASEVSLKWPNDLVTPDGKLAGVLTELVTADPAAVVVGIGLNCAWPPDWPADEDTARLVAGATTLSDALGRRVGRDELLEAFLVELELAYGLLLAPEGPSQIAAAWRAVCSTLGTEVSVETGEETLVGTARDIDANGALVLEVGGATVTLEVADVTHLRPSPPPLRGGPH